MAMIGLKNLGTPNANVVYLCDLTVWFSYETAVGFRKEGVKTVCRKNEWSTTTGKLLNEIEPDHSKRIDGIDFERALNDALQVVLKNEG